MSLIRRAFRKLSKMLGLYRPPLPMTDGFRAALRGLRPGDVAIDCGANLGIYTEVLARTGATVHAFEPDPAAFVALRERVGHLSNVHLHQAAVGKEHGTARLYLHRERDLASTYASDGSSLVESKTNINPETFVEVTTIDLAAFVEDQGPVALMKMDIEGYEVEVLPDLIERGAAARIARAFVEVHDRKNPQLAEPTARLRQAIAERGLAFDLDWH